MPKVVFVLGAGASAHTGTPLMQDFLDRSYALMEAGSVDNAKEEFALVADLLQNRLPLLDSKSLVDLENIESVFGLVEMAKLVKRLPRTKPDEIERVADAVKTVIGTTIEQTCRFPVIENTISPHAPYSALVKPLFESAKRGVPIDTAILSFNYDIALDVAVYRAGLQSDYGVDDEEYIEPDRFRVPVYKLHGSINWAQCRKCAAIVPCGIGMVRNWRYMPSASEDSTGVLPMRPILTTHLHCGEPTAARPAIVPPSWNKLNTTGGSHQSGNARRLGMLRVVAYGRNLVALHGRTGGGAGRRCIEPGLIVRRICALQTLHVTIQVRLPADYDRRT